MKICTLCKKEFDPEAIVTGPAIEAGRFMSEEKWQDGDDLCGQCLTNRGVLGLMYCPEFDG